MRKVTAEHYYDFSPGLTHSPGDIWTDVPTHGILGLNPVAGLVITPACDLAQGKVETITYLPIIPVTAYFSLTAALPEVRRAIEGQLTAANLKGLVELPTAYAPPTLPTITAATALLTEEESKPGKGAQERGHLRRALAGFTILRSIAQPGVAEVDANTIGLLFGVKDWTNMKGKIVTNSFRGDVHFLPADCQPLDWSGVPKHSLVLFRYPITAPIEVFDTAQDITLGDWKHCCERLSEFMPLAASFSSARPMKRLVLKADFIADLLTRFVSMYVRLGSPDFTPDTVTLFSDQIGCTK